MGISDANQVNFYFVSYVVFIKVFQSCVEFLMVILFAGVFLKEK